MKQKRLFRALSVLTSLIMFLSVLNIPALSVSADGIDGEPWIGAGENTEYVVPNSAAMDDFISNWYKVALERDPYPSELKQWKKELTGGVTCGSRAAYGFIFSVEYQNKKKSNSAFVTDLYKLMLGRTPDASGKADWVNQLKKGKSREQIFAGFANSTEYYKICNKLKITAGYWEAGYNPNQLNSVNMFVERLYKVCLGRIGDKDGQIDWVNKLIKGQITGSQCAHDFIFSDEYVKKKLSNGDYVKNLYTAIMGRTYDEAGYNSWVKKLSKGMSRDEVFAGFANSTEFDKICKNYGIKRGDYVPTDIGTYNPNPYKVGDIIKLGKYEQDGKTSNGPETIEWEVIAVEGNRVLVTSKYALEYMSYDNSGDDVTWETSRLRKWLNNDFYNEAFSSSEKSKIPKVTLENKKNPDSGRSGGNKTKDKVFCLSFDEVEKYYGYQYRTEWGTLYNQRLICEPTKYVLNQGIYTVELNSDQYYSELVEYDYTTEVIGKTACWYWLRSPGEIEESAREVRYNGSIGWSTYGPSGIRPAMYIEFE